MPGEEAPRFVAEGQHHVPAVSELERLLDRYETARRLAEPDQLEDEQLLEEREQFRLDYTAMREHALRASLEEVGWVLERRGHHAWIEHAPHEAADDLVDGAPVPVHRPLDPLVFRFLGADDERPRDEAGGVRFLPDADRCRVDVDAWYPGEQDEPVSLGRGFRLEDLTEVQVVALVTQLVGRVLLEGLPVVPEPPTPARPVVAPEDRQWASAGLAGREAAAETER